ncbi:hypothetical protein RND81_13G146100 [Saponaria officinalis]|uniref:F-box domain-containing protein n=1 Tax=Saponaria officinalis TaxID=3572 RepID=A0AAW1H0Q0_SAPOF
MIMSYNNVPNSPQNPNPNPKIPAITQSSSPNSPQISIPQPNWLLLPEDVWFSILSKLYTCDIIENAQKVCKLFRKICIQPSMFRIINMLLPDSDMVLNFDVDVMTRYAIDRSAGDLVDIYLEYCDDETLMYIVERSKNLKHLRIGHHIHISDDVLIDAVGKLSMLEEVEIIICDFSEETIEALGQACPCLKSFSLNDVGSRRYAYASNGEALAIANSMPNLRRLQLIGNSMTNEGLNAILDRCPLLESLDLRACFDVYLSGDLGKRCEKIKHLRRPNDSTADYSHRACTDGDETDDSSGSSMEEEPEYDYGFTEGTMLDIYPVPEYVELDCMDQDMYDDPPYGSDEYSHYDYCGCDCPCSDSD